METTESIVLNLEKSGADIIELGVPFSDPMADGPTIQRASERSLMAGTNLHNLLEIVKNIRKSSDIPLILFGYYNPFFPTDWKNLPEMQRNAELMVFW